DDSTPPARDQASSPRGSAFCRIDPRARHCRDFLDARVVATATRVRSLCWVRAARGLASCTTGRRGVANGFGHAFNLRDYSSIVGVEFSGSINTCATKRHKKLK